MYLLSECLKRPTEFEKCQKQYKLNSILQYAVTLLENDY
jgi:hypothetical protein